MSALNQVVRWTTIVGAVALFALSARAGEPEKFGRLSVAAVAKLVSEKSAIVYDNNDLERYNQGHVPGAIWASISEFDARVLPSDKNQTLVFYCTGARCTACHAGAEKAIELGYKNVFVMPDGLAGWVKSGKPLEKSS
jgi:rhodanese-related sulfurtransferase